VKIIMSIFSNNNQQEISLMLDCSEGNEKTFFITRTGKDVNDVECK
jgi:hypothetical protein